MGRRATKTRRIVRRVLRLFIGELRAILKRHAPSYYQRFPDAPRPCHTCAFNPSTDRMRGMDQTAVNMMNALRDGTPFICHEPLPYKKGDGWTVPLDALAGPLMNLRPCAGWWIVKDDPAATQAFVTAALKSDDKHPAVCGLLMR